MNHPTSTSAKNLKLSMIRCMGCRVVCSLLSNRVHVAKLVHTLFNFPF
jgi:hypothetical protein